MSIKNWWDTLEFAIKIFQNARAVKALFEWVNAVIPKAFYQFRCEHP